MKLPSVKTLQSVTAYPKELRKVLECQSIGELETLLRADKPFGKKSKFGAFTICAKECYRKSYNLHSLKMSMADELCQTYGVEYIPSGKNKRSPAIEYCNIGDPYVPTLMFVNGQYGVGCWGNIVESGNYD
jgi:hypothetical protein